MMSTLDENLSPTEGNRLNITPYSTNAFQNGFFSIIAFIVGTVCH